MDDLKRVEGKTIASVKENSDGVNSYLIIKFKEGGKMNISSYPNGDKGVGQIDIEPFNTEEELIGRRIHSVEENFDGASDHLIFTFKDGKKLTVSAFSTIQDGTAGMDITVYSDDKLVAESLNENKYRQWGQYALAQPQYENGGRSKGIEIIFSGGTVPEYNMVDLLKAHYDKVKPLGRSIRILDPIATIEDVSDIIYEYIEDGTVHTVDEI